MQRKPTTANRTKNTHPGDVPREANSHDYPNRASNVSKKDLVPKRKKRNYARLDSCEREEKRQLKRKKPPQAIRNPGASRLNRHRRGLKKIPHTRSDQGKSPPSKATFEPSAPYSKRYRTTITEQRNCEKKTPSEARGGSWSGGEREKKNEQNSSKNRRHGKEQAMREN